MDTKIKIKQSVLDSLDDKTLGWTCIEPVIQRIRGKNIEIKSQNYLGLTSGQKSLLLFWILFGHGQYGIIQFFKELDHLLIETNLWKEFADRLICFEDDNLSLFIKEMEIFYLEYTKTKIHSDTEFNLTVIHLDKKYKEIMLYSLKQVGKYIRNNPDEFVCIDD